MVVIEVEGVVVVAVQAEEDAVEAVVEEVAVAGDADGVSRWLKKRTSSEKIICICTLRGKTERPRSAYVRVEKLWYRASLAQASPGFMRDRITVGSTIRAKMAQHARRLANLGMVQSCT